MDLDQFLKQLRAHVFKGPTIARKSSPEKRAARREGRFKEHRLRRRQIARERAVQEERERLRQIKLLTATPENERE